MKKITLFLIAAMLVIAANAQTTTTFTNASGDNKWNNPDNWDNGTPGTGTHAVIPADKTVVISQGNVWAESIDNAGTIDVNNGTQTYDEYKINTNSLTNSGTLQSNTALRINSTGDDEKINISNTGTITGESSVTINDANNIVNSGDINGNSMSVYADDFYNQSEGTVGSASTYQISINSANYYNYGTCHADRNISIECHYALNNGIIQSFLGGVDIRARGDYFQLFGNGKVINWGDKVAIASTKTLVEGEINSNTNKSGKKGMMDQEAGHIEIITDTSWIAGDSVKIKSETIRIVFRELNILFVDSIRSLHANSKIELLGVAGSYLDLSLFNNEDILWVDNGDIFIYSDSIYSENDINYYCNVNPVVGPSDTTIIDSYIGSYYITDSAGGTGEINVSLRNNGTGSRTFEYNVSSKLGWVNTTTGNLQTLAPFQFDSLMIDYNIPLWADTLTDTVMITLSIPGEYTDTSYSYIRSYSTLNTGSDDLRVTDEIQFNLSPNPGSGPIVVFTSEPAQIYVFNSEGRLIDTFYKKKGEFILDLSRMNLPGIYLLKAVSSRSCATQKLILY